VPVLAHFGEDDDLVGFSDAQSAKNLKEAAYKDNVDFRLRYSIKTIPNFLFLGGEQ